MKKRGILLTGIFFWLFAMLAPQQASAQLEDPVSWEVSTEKIDASTVKIIFDAQIEKNWHLYAQYFPEGGPMPLVFSFDETPDYEKKGKTTEFPEPVKTYDEVFEVDVTYFADKARFEQIITRNSDKSFTINANADGQACYDDGKCVMVFEDFAIEIPAAIQKEEENQNDDTHPESGVHIDTQKTASDMSTDSLAIRPAENAQDSVITETEQTKISETKDSEEEDSKSMLGFFLLSVVLGLAGILTPCVFPMIPMTVSFFLQGQSSKASGIVKALIFGISIVILYSLVGIIVSLTSAGAGFTTALSTHWLPNLIFFTLFLVFAASFFGMFEMVLPSGLANKADKQVDKGGMMAAFFMALTLVIVSFSCTGPIVGALLVEAASGSVVKPTIGMLGFGLGFGLPFTFLAISPKWLKKLPQSGGWMNSVKVFMAFIMLAFSLKFLSNIDQSYHLEFLSRDLYLTLWIVIFGMLGLYLLGKIRLPHDSELKSVSVFRLLLAMASFSFALYLIPGLFGANLNSISGLIPPKTAQNFEINAVAPSTGTSDSGSGLCEEAKYAEFMHLPYDVQGYYDLAQGLECAKKQDKPALLYFTGHTCSNCKKMQGSVWTDEKVQDYMNNKFVVIALYIDERHKLPESEWITSEFDGKVKKTIGQKNADYQVSRFNVNAQPYYVIVSPNGEALNAPIEFETDPRAFIDWMDEGLEAYTEK